MITGRATTRQKGSLARHLAQLRKALSGPVSVDVGFPAGKVGPDIVAIASYQQFGTSRGIPARPFMTIALFRGERAIRGEMRQAARLTVTKTLPLATHLPRIGAYGATLIKQQIENNTPPPNAASTVRKKGHGRTLIDTGAMKEAVTWKIRR